MINGKLTRWNRKVLVESLPDEGDDDNCRKVFMQIIYIIKISGEICFKGSIGNIKSEYGE